MEREFLRIQVEGCKLGNGSLASEVLLNQLDRKLQHKKTAELD